MDLISIVVPCYNEEETLPTFYSSVSDVLKELNTSYEIIFINDGSKDNTLEIIKELSSNDKNVKYINFSRNFGKESGMLAGLRKTKGDYVVVIDSDMQHPPHLIKEMYDKIKETSVDVVSTRRVNRKGEPVIRSYFARKFYKIINKVSDVKLVDGAQDYRMMKRNVVDAVLQLKEYNRFSKGIFNWVGFDILYIEIENVERFAGETSWSFKGLLRYAIEGIVSFTTAPLRIATVFGIIISSISFLYLFVIVSQTILLGKDTPGYASTIVMVLFLGGIQLLALGVIGEYVAKTYLEVKGRPSYIIKDESE